MRRLILFSMPSEAVFERLFPALFPSALPNKVLACMPCEGALEGRRQELFQASWQALAREHGASCLFLDNALLDATEERARLLSANILLITGGNVCVLLRNLRRSGLDQAILDFARKDPAIIAGYSAGAMICTPSVEFAAFAAEFDENASVGLTDFRALHLVDYEIIPHYSADLQSSYVRYQRQATHPIRLLSDEDFLIQEL